MRQFQGNSSNRHQQNFIDCVRSRDGSALNTDVKLGNDSTGWCNLANIAFRAGQDYAPGEASELASALPLWGGLHEEMKLHLQAHGVEMTELRLSPILDFDPVHGTFSGAAAAQANSFLKREYRAPYVVPQIA